MPRSIACCRRREPLFADLRPAIADLWRPLRDSALPRIGPVGGLLLALLIVLWALGEHAQRRATLQEAETQRYVEQFTEGPVARAHARLAASWQGDRPDRTMVAPVAEAPSRALMRRVLLAEDVETVLRFYRRLALCVRMGSCDGAAAAAWFGDLPWRFRDRHRLYLEAAHPDEDLDSVLRTVSPRPDAEPEA